MMRFRFDEAKAAEAAAHLLAMANGRMAYLKLIKLLYLAERKSLEERARPISGDTFVSMDHGPVLSQTYNLIRGEGDGGEWTSQVRTENYDVALIGQAPELNFLSRYELKVLKAIHAEFGHMTRWQLRDYCHDHCPEWTNNSPFPPDTGVGARLDNIPDS